MALHMHWKMTEKKNTLPDVSCMFFKRLKMKKKFHSLILREGSQHCLWLSETAMNAKAKKNFFFIYSTLKNRLDTVYLRVKSQWMQKQNERANEWAVRANERADKQMTEYSTRQFCIISTQSALISFFTIRGCIPFPWNLMKGKK